MESLKLPFIQASQTSSESSITPSDYAGHTSPAQSLDNIFPSSIQENAITRTKRHLGNCMGNMSNEQLELINSQFQYLIDTWLDEFEQSIFNGSTLKEIVNNT